MKYLVKTEDHNILSPVDYSRVIWDTTEDSVFLQNQIGGGGEIINPSESVASDICFYDKTQDKLIIVKASNWSVEKYPIENYIPVGVVAVPGYHNVYGDGSCGVMSLKTMSCTDPENGSADNTYNADTNRVMMDWGSNGVNVDGIDYLLDVPSVGTITEPGDVNSTLIGSDSRGCLPSDQFTGVECPHDTMAKYGNVNPDDTTACPSPYLNNGSRNTAYYQLEQPDDNCLSDFNGIHNTDMIIAARGARDEGWKPTNTDGSDYSSASCCRLYHTEGTKQGDWYLPACGEFGYAVVRTKAINQTINTIINAYGNEYGVQLETSNDRYGYYTSTESMDVYSKHMDCKIGSISNYMDSKTVERYARAFIRVK